MGIALSPIIHEVASLVAFSLWPAKAKFRHIRQFRNPAADRLLYMAGTIHNAHFISRQFPISDLAGLIDGFDPDCLLLEMREDYLARDWLADGPADMAYCAHLAVERGMPVRGIDDWCDRHVEREDRMFRNTLAAMERQGGQRFLLLTGYSHIHELAIRLPEAEYSEMPVPEDAMRRMMGRGASMRVPAGLPDGLRRAAGRAERGETPFSRAWARSRRRLADKLEAGAARVAVGSTS
ncbi:hypothetical protein [Aurantimonas marina]|uniref:hypothetical protein n=1 Tax=Aurantimonas marina TaxID=2780508 RepID=UPI0019D1EFF2|nr:hypothetical protein [Aurantimonas marina]